MHHSRLISAVFIFVIFVSNALTWSDENREMSVVRERFMEESSEERERFEDLKTQVIINNNMTNILKHKTNENNKNHKYAFIIVGIIKLIFIIYRLRRICKWCKKKQQIEDPSDEI